jgi:hypothetical protein
MSQHLERRATESLLRLIAEGAAPAIGEEFFAHWSVTSRRPWK